MNRITPWSVKGVDDDAREMARKAAQAEGMTLGAWIDRAIRKSTGLPVEPLDSSASTTGGTTSFQASPIDRGEIVEVDYRTTSSDDTPSTDHVDVAGVATDAGSDETAPDSRSTPPELQLDPEERFGAGVEVTNTPSRRRWRSLPGLFDVRGRMVHLSAAGLVIGAGLLIYWVAFTGPDDPGPAAAATQDNANRSIAPPLPATPGLAERDDTPPPSEPGVIEMLTAAADQGDAVAQHDLAVRFLDGKTVDADPDKARAWMERAATQGMARAQHRLAVMYADGKGVGADANRAAMWHTRAASQGHPGSQHALALAYAAGRGVKPSEAAAVEWLRRAARAGNAPSQALLAERYATGRGVPRDRAKAIEWFGRAAAKGHAGAAARVTELREKAAAPPAPKPDRAKTAAAKAPPVPPAPPANAPLGKSGIVEVQRLLARLAFKPGPADGVLGQHTVREIKLYQRFAGLPDDGKATPALLQELREMVRGMAAETRPKAR